MSKYRVTDKHPFFIKGVVLVRVDTSNTHFHYEMENNPELYFKAQQVGVWAENNCLEEIKEVVYNTAWVEKMKLVDDILSKYHIEDIETLKKILEHEDKNKL